MNEKFSALNLKIASAISLLILLSSIPSSFASSLNSTLDQQGNYLNPSLGIGFQVPEGWVTQEPKKSEPGAPDIAVVAPYSGRFTPSISFIVEKANGTSLDDYFQNKKIQILKDGQSQNVTFLSEQDSTINAHNAKIAILREGFTTPEGGVVIKFKEAFFLANDNLYTITYANEEKNFDASLLSYDTLLNSITFTNEQNSLSKDYWFAVGGIGTAIAIVAILVITKMKKRSG